jgi:DNA-3-methyladenine glycosylase I
VSVRRCSWARGDALTSYHDEEWGVPVHDDRRHFEFLVLEGAQAGLSWLTILRKRARYREVFRGFEPEAVARFTAADVRRLLADPGIVRNRLKVESAVTNARAFLGAAEEFGAFDRYVWRFVEGAPIVRAPRRPSEVRCTSPESDALSRDLKKRGFRFVGSTICYSYMQATGLVNDHLAGCFRRRAVSSSSSGGTRRASRNASW